MHHIGYLVKDIDKSKATFLALGYEIEKNVIFDSFRGVNICFLRKKGCSIELVSPVGDNSILRNLKKRVGVSPYHICYCVNNIDDAITDLCNMRFVIWEEPHEAPAIEGKRVVFLFHSQMGLIELVEE
ncbi:MAG: VOC family protein [Sphaerochaetaceae bacterium]|nr:VOC family protein [Sphaerochaetaceae bacterium]